MRILFKPLFSSFFILLFTLNALTQIITSNDGFEGTPTHHYPPPGWNNCADRNSTIDTQPGPLHNTMPASQGETYISVVARELNPPGTVETVWADLIIPFKKDHCYTLLLDLTLSHEFYGTLDWQDYYFDNPCRLQILGLNGECSIYSQMELLWQSDVIDHFEWQNYEITIRPQTSTFNRIAFRAEFVEPGVFKNSALMIDNLRCSVESGSITELYDNLYLPEGATTINWFCNDSLINQHTNPLPIAESGHYSATFFNSDSCLVITSDDFYESSPETIYGLNLYPIPTFDHVTIEFISSKVDYCNIALIDNLGKEISSISYKINTGINKLLVPMENLATGNYFIIFTTSKGKNTIFKVVKCIF